jgi:hypothetical protein
MGAGVSGLAPSDFDLAAFVARCKGRSRKEVIAFAQSEDHRAAAARRHMSGRGAVARRRQVQDYADAMRKVVNIAEHGGSAILTPRQAALQPLIERLLNEPKEQPG